MKNLTVLFFLILLSSCQVFEDDKEDLPRVEGYEKVVVIDDCEYIEYKSTFYCGHQYSHHEYRAALLTHKGNCKNHEQNTELRTPKTSVNLKVQFNKEKFKFRTFKEYAELYIDSAFYERSENWEVAISPTNGGFQAISFVNSRSISNLQISKTT